MTDAGQHKADWYPDPMGRHQYRYWDGSAWTDDVANNGVQAKDPLQGGALADFGGFEVGGKEALPERIQAQLGKAGVAPASASPSGGGGGLFDEPVLVVNQKAKLIEVTSEYRVFDQHGTQVGAVRQIGQSSAKKLLRMVSNLDQFMTHTFQIVDATGAVQLQVTRPRKIMKSTVLVEDAAGTEIGRVVQQNMIGKIRFSLDAGGASHGTINAENWRAWNFNIQDASGNEVARITKTWEGLGKAMFTTADNYVLQIHSPLSEPLRSLVIAAALCVDTALKQDSGGFS
jgi:uncharacterized protein YxjI